MNIKIKCYRKDCKYWLEGNCRLKTITLFIEDTVGCDNFDAKNK